MLLSQFPVTDQGLIQHLKRHDPVLMKEAAADVYICGELKEDIVSTGKLGMSRSTCNTAHAGKASLTADVNKYSADSTDFLVTFSSI